MDNFHFIFNGQKADITQVRSAFNRLFTNKTDEIFEVIFENQNLRNSLFDINSVMPPKQQFNQLIDNTSSYLYKFIKAD